MNPPLYSTKKHELKKQDLCFKQAVQCLEDQIIENKYGRFHLRQ